MYSNHAGSIIDEEEEEEEESEVASEEEEEVVSKGPQPLPGLGDVSDVMLVEQWHALFVGTCMEAAATSGHVVVTRSELACFIKIGVPSGRSEVRAMHDPHACINNKVPAPPTRQYLRTSNNVQTIFDLFTFSGL